MVLAVSVEGNKMTIHHTALYKRGPTTWDLSILHEDLSKNEELGCVGMMDKIILVPCGKTFSNTWLGVFRNAKRFRVNKYRTVTPKEILE